MNVSSHAYVKFYLDLIGYLRDYVLSTDEWHSKTGKPYKDFSKEWWFIQREVNGRRSYVSLLFTDGISNDNQLFYRKLCEYGITQLKTKIIEFKGTELIALGTALKVIKFKNFDPEIEQETSSVTEKRELEAITLFQWYLRQADLNLYHNHMEINVFSPRNNVPELLPSEQNRSIKTNSNYLSYDNFTSEEIKEIKSFKAFLNFYHDALQGHDMEVAFKCWNPDTLQKIWNGEIQQFKKQFAFSSIISNIEYFAFNIYTKHDKYVLAECKVFYTEAVYVRIEDELDFLLFRSFIKPEYMKRLLQSLYSEMREKLNFDVLKKFSAIIEKVSNSNIEIKPDIALLLKKELIKILPASYQKEINRLLYYTAFKYREDQPWLISQCYNIKTHLNKYV